MRIETKEVKIYGIEDLLENASLKEKCYNNWYNSKELYFDELEKTLKEFESFFNIKTRWSFDSCNGNITGCFDNIEDNILELKGIRLLRYIQNNYSYNLFKGKCFSLWSKKEKSFKYHKNGFPVLKQRYSKVIYDNTCVLTGVCYDEDILKPIYDFIKNPCEYITLKDLLNNCLQAWLNVAIEEYAYQLSEECFFEELEANGWEFNEEGFIC